MKTPRKISRNQVFFTALLVLLGLLALLLWLIEPRPPSGDSRAKWPAIPSAQN